MFCVTIKINYEHVYIVIEIGCYFFFQKTKKCSLVLSLAQSDYCNKKSYDPEDPRCAQLTLTGKFVKVP